MQFTVYCDESRHSGGKGCQFAVIGSLWVNQEHRSSINKELKELKNQYGINSELKWSKVSRLKINSYSNIADYFWGNKHLLYRAIIIDQSSVDYETFHDGDVELGFYKFYYEMLEKWIIPGNSYNILLDYKNNSEQSRLPALLRCLENYSAPRGINLNGLTSIDSSQSNLAQLCDILTGAIAADANGIQPSSPKHDLVKRLAKLRGASPLSMPSYSPALSKFNIFKIALKGKVA